MDKPESSVTDNKPSFAEKHPRLIKALSLLMFALLVYGGWKLLGFLVSKAKIVLAYISTLEAVIIVALITGSITVITTIISKIIDYQKSKREYLAQKREEPYEAVVEMFYKIHNIKNQEYKKDEMIRDISNINKKLTLWGSSNVVNKWVAFRQASFQNDNKNQNILFLLEDLMNAMRKDMGTRKVKKGNLLAFSITDIKQVLKKK